MDEILNLQPKHGKAKPYQVKQVIREWIETARELGRSIPEAKGRLRYA